MNKKGQALVMFILFIPVFMLIIAFIVDGGRAFTTKYEIISVVKSALKHDYDINDSLIDNNINYKKLKIQEENNRKCVIIDASVESIFGNIIGIKEYKIKINECRG